MARSAEKIMVLQPRDPWAEIRVHTDEGRIELNLQAEAVRLSKVRRLSLIVEGEVLVGLCVSRRIARSGAFDVLVRLEGIFEIEPLPIAELLAALPAGFSARWGGALWWNGILPPATGREVITAITTLRPGTADVIDDLKSRLAQRSEATGTSQQNVREQRDAVALGLELTGIDSRAALGEEEPSSNVPFLMGLLGTTHESAILRSDAGRFADWMQVESEHFDVHRFQDPTNSARRATVLYADKGPLESLTGTDLIYYREETRAFVLVQYKRMVEESGQLYYRPDKQLDAEIERFVALNLPVSPPSSVAESRLSTDPFYIKLVEPSIRRPDGNKLAVGMYFPLELFQLVRESLPVQGPKGGVRIGWSNAQRYITNGQFIALVQESWIGTRGDASNLLEELIQTTLNNQRAMVVVADETDYNRVESRRP